MNAGQLREFITFQQKTYVSDGGGGRSSTWANSFNDRARIKPLLQEEQIQQEQNQQQNKFEITVRYQSAITRNLRIVWGSKTLAIISGPINIDEKQKWLQLIARQE